MTKPTAAELYAEAALDAVARYIDARVRLRPDASTAEKKEVDDRRAFAIRSLAPLFELKPPLSS